MKAGPHFTISQIPPLEKLMINRLTQCNIKARTDSGKLIFILALLCLFHCSNRRGHKPAASIVLLSNVLYKECNISCFWELLKKGSLDEENRCASQRLMQHKNTNQIKDNEVYYITLF